MNNIKNFIYSLVALTAILSQSAQAVDFSATLTNPVQDATDYENVSLTVNNGTTIDEANNDAVSFLATESASLNNAGTIRSTNAAAATDAVAFFGPVPDAPMGTSVTIVNTGTIQANSFAGSNAISVGNTSLGHRTTITNSGTIAASGFAILSDNAITLNIQNGSVITGDVSAGAPSILNIQQGNALSVTTFNNILNGQLQGTWQRTLDHASASLTIGSGETLGSVTDGNGTRTVGLNAGSITNNGTLSMAAMSGGTLSSTTGSTLTVTSLSGGTLNAFGTSTVGTMSGGTFSNAGTAAITTLSGGTFTNLNSASVTNMSGGTFSNQGTLTGNTAVSGGAFTNTTGSSTTGVTTLSGTGSVVNQTGATINTLSVIAGTGSFSNAGTITTMAMTGSAGNNSNNTNTGTITSISQMDGGTLTNTGTIGQIGTTGVMGGGVINNNTGGSITSIVKNGGILNNNSGSISTLQQSGGGGTTTNSGTGSITTVEISAGALNQQSSTAIGTVTQTGGTVNNSATRSITSLSISAGTLNNSGSIATVTSVSNTATFNNLAGSSVTTINAMSGATSFTNSGAIGTITTLTGGTATNRNGGSIGTVNVNGGTLEGEAGGTITTATLNSGAVLNTGSLTTLNFNAGSVTNVAGGTISRLNLMSGQALGNIANSGTVSNLSTGVDGTANITYSNVMSGNGSFTKTGTGRLEITGTNNTHSGTFDVAAGELKVNGSTASLVTIESGATMSGVGTIGSLTVNSGGVLASGNSIGTLHVLGAVNLNAGSISNFEFNETAIDKTIAGGNITISNNAIANFSFYNTQGGYFVVDQNILETTGGTVSGYYGTVTTPETYVADLQYSTQAVRATIAKKVDSSVLDGTLSSQNSVGRMLNKTVFEKLLAIKDSRDEEAKLWISTGGFDNHRDAVANSANNSSTGIVTSAGIVKNYKTFQLLGGVFNAKSNVKRYGYSGDDDVETNGVMLGAGKSFGNLYLLAQTGAGVYDLHNNRQVNVNGVGQNARGVGKGRIQYAGVAASYKLPLDITGELALFGSTRVQKTTNAGWQERGLSAGNLNFAQSSAQTINYEIGTSYQNNFARFFHLPEKSLFRVEVSGFKTDLYSKKDALVTMGSVNYKLSTNYEERLLVGVNGYVSVPVLKTTNFVASAGRKENGRYKEVTGTLGFEVSF